MRLYKINIKTNDINEAFDDYVINNNIEAVSLSDKSKYYRNSKSNTKLIHYGHLYFFKGNKTVNIFNIDHTNFPDHGFGNMMRNMSMKIKRDLKINKII
jgi:hypothetical protein